MKRAIYSLTVVVALFATACGSGGGDGAPSDDGKPVVTPGETGSGTLHANWQPGPTPNVPDVVVLGYRLYWSKKSGTYTDQPLEIPVQQTSAVVTGLDSGDWYYFVATAYGTVQGNSAESEKSQEFAVRAP